MSLKGQVILGLKWTTFATVCVAVATILKISILARFLEKSDYQLITISGILKSTHGLCYPHDSFIDPLLCQHL